MTFKPMLAATLEDPERLRYPVIVSPKIDGIRCVVRDGQALARSLKPIPNAFTRSRISQNIHADGMDGELLVGSSFQACTSAIMSIKGAPSFQFWVFDYLGNGCTERTPYHERLWHLERAVERASDAAIQAVPTKTILGPRDLLEYEAEILGMGFEGVMVRAPAGPYKFGRSTLKEGHLLKLKRFVDFEARVVGFEEQKRNTNEATTNELGRTKRSSAKAGKVGKGTLGTLVLARLSDGVVFGCGTGFDDATRAHIWAHQNEHLGRVAKVKCQPYGEKDAPRLPVFLGWRDEADR